MAVFSLIYSILLIQCFITVNTVLSSSIVNLDGNWKIVNYPQYPQCNGIQATISRDERNEHIYRISTNIVNWISCSLQFDHSTNKWTPYGCSTTLMLGPPEYMEKESIISKLFSTVQRIEIPNEQQLIITTSTDEQVQFSRL